LQKFNSHVIINILIELQQAGKQGMDASIKQYSMQLHPIHVIT